MDGRFVTLIIYCGLILTASLAGGWLPLMVRLTHKRLEVALSFVAGVMLGIGVLHMLPHAILLRTDSHGGDHAHGAFDHASLLPVMGWLIAGFLLMFFTQRFLRYHQHEAPDGSPGSHGGHACTGHHDHGNGSHDHDHHHDHGESSRRPSIAWAGAAAGLTIHSLLEGLALAASVAHDSGDPDHSRAAASGLGVFIVILLHKPFDAMTISALLAAAGKPRSMIHVVNVLFSLVVAAGAIGAMLGLGEGANASAVISAALALSAGSFLCIALSDLLPELQFHRHDRVKLSLALLAGLALAWVLAWVEARGHEKETSDQKSEIGHKAGTGGPGRPQEVNSHGDQG